MERMIMFLLTLLLAGRAMTLAFITRAGGPLPGDPPAAWLMPLIGDAVIGVTALVIAFLILRKRGLWVWMAIIVWNSVAIWDALSAYLVHLTTPWPEFFMLHLFGPSLFFAASALHLVLILLATRPKVRTQLLN